ncbi:MAG: bifunctional adenosylcobinamide kinase/adenosylcobinamide-phosphate guanylyltransferase [Lachnospiraceae bacterium]
MKLIIGGYSQGKLNYVLRKIGENEYQICDGTLLDDIKSDTEEADSTNTIVIINHLHTFIKTSMQRGENPKESVLDFITKYPDCILISDEIGNGIVPMDAFEREYREQTGRILIELAKEAEEVIRVICGIGQKIK